MTQRYFNLLCMFTRPRQKWRKCQLESFFFRDSWTPDHTHPATCHRSFCWVSVWTILFLFFKGSSLWRSLNGKGGKWWTRPSRGRRTEKTTWKDTRGKTSRRSSGNKTSSESATLALSSKFQNNRVSHGQFWFPVPFVDWYLLKKQQLQWRKKNSEALWSSKHFIYISIGCFQQLGINYLSLKWSD